MCKKAGCHRVSAASLSETVLTPQCACAAFLLCLLCMQVYEAGQVQVMMQRHAAYVVQPTGCRSPHHWSWPLARGLGKGTFARGKGPLARAWGRELVAAKVLQPCRPAALAAI
jgi:hypothetical protein